MTHTSETHPPTYCTNTRWGRVVIDYRPCWVNYRPMSYYYTIPLVKRKPRDA